MGAETRLVPASCQDINLTAIMEAEGIVAIKNWCDGLRFSVELRDGRFGVGRTVGAALAKAKRADAPNIRRAA